MLASLTTRQQDVLRLVVESYAASGQPVGSKALAANADLTCGPSTIRAELGRLEEIGLLAHPHTSAGRVPTESGYRFYVDHIVPQATLVPSGRNFELSLVRREVDEAMRATTEALSQVTNLLAIATAPSIASATVRHVEVLVLQPQVVMVVVITSTGGVSKRLFSFNSPVDNGLADWAGEYLNERLVGMGLGARMLASRINDPGLNQTERAFLATVAPAFTNLADTAQDTLYFDGASRLVSELQFHDVRDINALMELLEQRVSLLGVVSAALDRSDVYVRIGAEMSLPALRTLSLVAANYGLPRRNLGTVSVIGPLRMDYPTAIRTVREAASALSRFVEDVYED